MTKYETCLRQLLAELLETPAQEVALDQTLAELGVDSLIGLRFARRINDALGIEVELEWLFDYPTIAQLAALLERQTSVA
jgi:acyl carrier protein